MPVTASALSQPVDWLAGSTVTSHDPLVPELTVKLAVATAGAFATASVTVVCEGENAPRPGCGPVNVVAAVELTGMPVSSKPSNSKVVSGGGVAPDQQTCACSMPRAARRLVPKSCWIRPVQSAPPAWKRVSCTAKPLCSWRINWCDHWQDGSAAGFRRTAAGALSRVISGVVSGPSRTRVDVADHWRPPASTPVNTYTRLLGTVAGVALMRVVKMLP